MAPSVAVIIPCHDDGELLSEAVRSLEGEPGLELVIVDDASSDGATLAILDELETRGVRVVHHETNKRLAAARNTGLDATSAPLVFALDADDLAVPGAIAGMAQTLSDHPDAAACFGDYTLLFGDRDLVVSTPPRLDPYRAAFRNEFGTCALFRRSALEAVGGWTDIGDPIGYEDWDLWLTLAERGDEAIQVGAGVITHRKRMREGSMLGSTRSGHAVLYATLKERHPGVYGSLEEHRRKTDLGALRARLYPVLFGARRRPRLESTIKLWLYRRRARPEMFGDPSS